MAADQSLGNFRLTNFWSDPVSYTHLVYLGEDAADNPLQNPLVDFTKAVSSAEKLERIRNILPPFIREEGTAYYDRFRGDILISV